MNSIFKCATVGLVLLACADSKKTPAEIIKESESLFSKGKYAEALEIYESLIVSQGSIARVGAGWCQLRLGNRDEANLYFADAAPDSLTDGFAGWSLVLWANNSPDISIAMAEIVLKSDSNFVLSLDKKFTFKDLYWIEAADYLQLGHLETAVSKIKKIDPSFSPNLSDPFLAKVIAEKLQSLGVAH